ncbi:MULTISPECIES: hypothetical protein [Methylobacterium]|uniref:hypothetical protein n=1 Tax=Methylobacterium TaxID=407 RepID=UPI0013EA4AD7|nr:hypothetical protein [Methylobacterium sp. DB0501]NGM36752.1 hypothetical protein [Methylobacterium sp. DB0501]
MGAGMAEAVAPRKPGRGASAITPPAARAGSAKDITRSIFLDDFPYRSGTAGGAKD